MHYCHIAASCLLTYTSVAFYTLHYGSISRGATRGQGGRNYPGAKSLWGRQKVPTMSHVHSSIQYVCFRKTPGSKMGAPNLFFAPGAIWPRYAPLNLEISSVKKLIHAPLCRKTTMQTNCGLTNCTGNSPETGFWFSFWRLVKSWVSNTFSILHSHFYCCLSFSFQGGHRALKK